MQRHKTAAEDVETRASPTPSSPSLPGPPPSSSLQIRVLSFLRSLESSFSFRMRPCPSPLGLKGASHLLKAATAPDRSPPHPPDLRDGSWHVSSVANDVRDLPRVLCRDVHVQRADIVLRQGERGFGEGDKGFLPRPPLLRLGRVAAPALLRQRPRLQPPRGNGENRLRTAQPDRCPPRRPHFLAAGDSCRVHGRLRRLSDVSCPFCLAFLGFAELAWGVGRLLSHV